MIVNKEYKKHLLSHEEYKSFVSYVMYWQKVTGKRTIDDAINDLKLPYDRESILDDIYKYGYREDSKGRLFFSKK